jgi:hypothetical protein
MAGKTYTPSTSSAPPIKSTDSIPPQADPFAVLKKVAFVMKAGKFQKQER